jgi:hypothetical protein
MKDPIHIDEAALRRVLSGELRGEEARRVAEHLGDPCEACDAFLASRGKADSLDGALDLALLERTPLKSPGPDERGNDLEWARIQRRLRPRRPAWRLAGFAVAAVALLAAGVVLRMGSRAGGEQGWDGLKGRAVERASARLRFSVSLPGPAAPVVERAASGAVVPPEASLLFRVEVSGPARMALLRLDPEGEVIWEGRAERAGAIDVEIGGRPAAYPLRGLAGRQRFALLAAPTLDAETLEAARRALSGSGSASAPGPAISLDLVEVTVR